MLKKIFWTLSSILLLLLTIFLYSNRQSIIVQMNNWNLLPKEESFTELYFENHTKLPDTIEPDKKYSFKFTVHNLENKDFTYNYSITKESSTSATLILKKGTFSLKNDAYKTINESFSFPEPLERSKIAVNLVNKHQSIHFWTLPVVE